MMGNSYELIEFNSKGVEEFPVGFGGVDIRDQDNIASLIKVGDDIIDFDLAFGV